MAIPEKKGIRLEFTRFFIDNPPIAFYDGVAMRGNTNLIFWIKALSNVIRTKKDLSLAFPSIFA